MGLSIDSGDRRSHLSSLDTPSDQLPDNQSRSGFDLCGIYIDIEAQLTDKHVNGSTVMSGQGACSIIMNRSPESLAGVDLDILSSTEYSFAPSAAQRPANDITPYL
jgi:hypothetical protein